MSQNLFKKSREIVPAAGGEDKIAVDLFFKHASVLLSRYEQWKDMDRFYFIPLKLDMAYFCGGGTYAVACPPVWEMLKTHGEKQRKHGVPILVLHLIGH